MFRSRLLRATVKFYTDVLLLENFAIMNYCGFSKILKKHDKLTGFSNKQLTDEYYIIIVNFCIVYIFEGLNTRAAYMRNILMKERNFTGYYSHTHQIYVGPRNPFHP